MGEFGFFLQCLELKYRIEISEVLNIHTTSHNQNGRILEDIIFLLKELRNAVAHNGVAFDCRFKKTNPPSRLTSYIESETSITNIRFINIVDYFILVVIILKKLDTPKREIQKLLRDLENHSENLRAQIPIPIHTSIMGSDFRKKLMKVKNYI